jgi:hypothetical protein
MRKGKEKLTSTTTGSSLVGLDSMDVFQVESPERIRSGGIVVVVLVFFFSMHFTLFSLFLFQKNEGSRIGMAWGS